MTTTDGIAPVPSPRTARLEELRERATSVRAELAAIRVTVRSRDDAVSITVGAGGVMQAITFGPKANGLSSSKLGTSVMAAYRTGCRQSAERSVEVMSTLVGPESATLALMRNAVPPEDEADDSTVAR